MKKTIFIIAALSLLLVSCVKNPNVNKEKKEQEQKEVVLSNISNDESIKEVTSILKTQLDEKNVDTFINGVKDYNETIKYTGLNGNFEKKEQPEYDVETIDNLWAEKKGDFIGTNCRLNTFMLLKGNIEITKGNIDDSLLFMDKDAMKTGNIFNPEDEEQFKQLFSKLKTEATGDIHIHAQKMQEHFSNVKFNDKARMISVVLHDNLDGDCLFIGHVGVLTENNGSYLFVEKLSFQEPFQAVKFENKEDCYHYLFLKYKDQYDPSSTAKPFIMDNNELVESELYNMK